MVAPAYFAAVNPKAASRTALVTGASSGIGLELARLFAADGVNLVLVARSAGRLQQLASEFSQVNVHVVAKDLSQPHAPQSVFAELSQRSISVDYLINNAGFGAYGKFADLRLDQQLEMVQLNVTALVHLTHLFLPQMIARRSGRIMNVASTAAFQPGPLMAVYYATKAFVLSFSEAIANELSGTGVTVTCFCPGATRTEFAKRADMENSRLFRLAAMDVKPVSLAGYRGMMAGKTLVIPGVRNKLMAQSVRLGPRKIVAAIARSAQEQRLP